MSNKLQFDGYSIVRPLGSGGSGYVYLAVNETTSQKVAIKVLRSDASLSEDSKLSLQRFSDEAAAAVKVQSKFVVKAFNWDFTKENVPLKHLVLL